MVTRVRQACVGRRVILHRLPPHPVSLVVQVHRATMDPRATPGWPDNPDCGGIPDPGGRTGFLDSRGIRVPRVRKAPAALQDVEGQRANRECRALRGHRAAPASFCRGISCCRGEKEIKATRERRGVWENRETPVMDRKETKGCRVWREKQERMETGVNLDLRENLASEVIQDTQDLKDSRVKRGTGAQLVHLEI